MANRLARETSPYLRQHKDNPVDWYAWGPEAVAAATERNVPILLSVGYSACHWCHVMAHECFEDDDVSAEMNRLFVNIKVDREERPDVDAIYMEAVQALTGRGGWPMTVFLTPAGKPFYGGTYFPKPQFLALMHTIDDVWRNKQADVEQNVSALMDALGRTTNIQPNPDVPGVEVINAALAQFAQNFDEEWGGFGAAPKFPSTMNLDLVLRAHARHPSDAARTVVITSLDAMASGGMYDHIGGGFARYSVDREWLVPHFEKMLYDQAQLVLAYLEAAQASDDPFFAQVAEDTLQYVQRDMTDEAGGFYSAEDADSIPPTSAKATAGRPAPEHKMEGAFYIWEQAEVRAALGDDSLVFEGRYGVLPNGNAPFDPQQEFVNKNLLHTAQSIADLARASGQTPVDIAEVLLRARKVLFDVRNQRPRPQLDDKVLTAWNGLMIAACARAARVLLGHHGRGDSGPADDGPGVDGAAAARHLESAVRAATFIKQIMWDASTGRLLRRYRAGDAAIEAYAEDFAYLVFGVLELFQATGQADWLSWARALQARQDELFWDSESGGWFSTTGADPSVLLRMKEDYDGAEPSPTSVSAMNCWTLAHLTGEASYRERAASALASFGGRLEDQGRAVPFMASALSASLAGGEQIVIVGRRDADDTQVLWRAAHQRYRPFAVMVLADPAEQAALAVHMPWVAEMKMIDNQATAYVCRDFALMRRQRMRACFHEWTRTEPGVT